MQSATPVYVFSGVAPVPLEGRCDGGLVTSDGGLPWLERAGYARFRCWRVYAERGLGGEPVAVWLYAEHLTLVCREEPLVRYRVTYEQNQRRLQTVTPEQLFETPHRSPQPPLWAWGEDEWFPVLRLPAYAPRRRPWARGRVQLSLFVLEQAEA